MSRQFRVRPAVVLSAAGMAAVLVVGAASVQSASAAQKAAPKPAADPPLTLMRAAPAVTIDRWQDGPVRLDLGVHVVAGKDPVELRVTRKSYADPVQAVRIVRSGTKTKNVALPAGLITDFAGLDKFTHTTLTDAAGKVAWEQDDTICLNAEDASRMRPDAPARSPYPPVCSTSPFALGSVQGLQAGWGVNSVSGSWRGTANIANGTYTAHVTVGKAYRDFFGIPASQGDVSVAVTVRSISDSGLRKAAPQGHVHGLVPAPGSRPGKVRQPAAVRPTGTPAKPTGPRPDLRALPAYDVTVSGSDSGTGRTANDGKQYLSFSATVWNAGPSPLVVDGFRQPGGTLMDAYQYFFDAKGNQVGYAPTGSMEWDPREGHRHWHFRDFASYRLLDETKKLVVRSQKEAFCLAPTDGIDLTVKLANFTPYARDLHTACGQETSASIRQTLDVGWGDTYVQSLPGQSFDLTDMANGTYYIETAANPAGKLFESNTKNNVAFRKVIIGGTPGARTVQVPPYDLVTAP